MLRRVKFVSEICSYSTTEWDSDSATDVSSCPPLASHTSPPSVLRHVSCLSVLICVSRAPPPSHYTLATSKRSGGVVLCVCVWEGSLRRVKRLRLCFSVILLIWPTFWGKRCVVLAPWSRTVSVCLRASQCATSVSPGRTLVTSI